MFMVVPHSAVEVECFIEQFCSPPKWGIHIIGTILMYCWSTVQTKTTMEMLTVDYLSSYAQQSV